MRRDGLGGGVISGATDGGKRRVEGKWGKASASAGGTIRGRKGRTGDKVENGRGDEDTGGSKVFS